MIAKSNYYGDTVKLDAIISTHHLIFSWEFNGMKVYMILYELVDSRFCVPNWLILAWFSEPIVAGPSSYMYNEYNEHICLIILSDISTYEDLIHYLDATLTFIYENLYITETWYAIHVYILQSV